MAHLVPDLGEGGPGMFNLDILLLGILGLERRPAFAEVVKFRAGILQQQARHARRSSRRRRASDSCSRRIFSSDTRRRPLTRRNFSKVQMDHLVGSQCHHFTPLR